MQVNETRVFFFKTFICITVTNTVNHSYHFENIRNDAKGYNKDIFQTLFFYSLYLLFSHVIFPSTPYLS